MAASPSVSDDEQGRMLLYRRLFQRLDSDYDHHRKDGERPEDFEQFLAYCQAKERVLRRVFDALDQSKSGALKRDDVRAAMEMLQMRPSNDEVDRMMRRISSSAGSTGVVTWAEWRDHMLFAPTTQVADLFRYWTAITDEYEVAQEAKAVWSGDRWWKQLVAGGVAGAVSRTCTAPLDRLKTILQAHPAEHNLGFRGGLLYMYREGGWRSMWRGNLINAIKITPESAIKFFVWDVAKSLIYRTTDDPNQITTLERLAAGSIAGVVSQACIFPLEVVKTRLATGRTGQYSGIWSCARRIYAEHGFRGFYRGMTPAMLGIMPYAGIDLTVYETLKTKYVVYRRKKPDDFVVLICGMISSTCGQLASYPLALVRTRMQADSKNRNNMLQEFGAVVRKGGVAALYRGMAANCMKVAPAVSISYVIFERMRVILGLTPPNTS